MTNPTAEIGVFGGSGFYSLLGDGAREHLVETPYGAPSDVVVTGEVAGRSVAFLPRHGRRHEYPPHRIPYRANVWARRALGVRQILALCGGITGHGCRPGRPGGLRPARRLDAGSPRHVLRRPRTRHISFSEPYDPWMRDTIVAVARRLEMSVHETGTMVVVEGPRFSTAAESRIFARLGCSVVNMTGCPEAALVRELALGYATIALITDHDAGILAELEQKPVTQEAVVQMFSQNLKRLRRLLVEVIAELPAEPSPMSARALDDATFG